MKLQSVQIQKFKSVRDSGTFKIDETVTCLVGKNESGKTAILQAIARFNPITGNAKFLPLEYPRDLVGGPDSTVDVLTTVWQLDEDDAAAVNEVLGPGVVSPQEVTIKKGYYDGHRWTVKSSAQAALRHLIARNPIPESSDVESAGTISKAIEALAGVPDSPAHQALRAAFSATYPDGTLETAVNRLLEARLPKMVYIPEYFRMPGEVSIDDLMTRRSKGTLEIKHEVFLAFLDFAGVTPEDLIGTTEYEPLIAKLEWASNQISKQIFAYWTQNRQLRVRVVFDQGRPGDPPPLNSGYVVRTRIENTRHNVSVSFDERSAGFVWFFSFLVWFSQARKKYGNNLVCLLDEPGLSLHAKAQADLLRYIDDKLAVPPFQVIYSTHSPFLVEPQRLNRVRTVEDVWLEPKADGLPIADDLLGTKVGSEVLSTDRDTVFPLQAALGYEITQSLFIGKNTLLVEGPSEILYLQWFSKRLGAAGLSPAWTICPCGGIDKVPAFLSLFSGNALNVAILTDFATGQKKKVDDLKKSRLLEAGRVFTCDFLAEQPEADIEDVLGRDFYVELVNQTYGLTGASKVPVARPAKAPQRVVKEVEAHFGVLPPGAPDFDHFDPSSYLIQQKPSQVFPGADAATARFGTLFAALNKLLPR